MSYKAISDELIRRCQEGDRAAFDTLLHAEYDIIYRIAYKWCGDQHNAEDIAQQACIKLANNIGKFGFESNFSSWLYRLVINCAKDYYKSPTQNRQAANETTDEVVQTEASIKSKLEQQHYARQILEHISRLPDDLRDALVLVFGNGLNHREAAEQLSIKESTVSWRVHEARKLLKQTFESTNFENTTTAETTSGGAV